MPQDDVLPEDDVPAARSEQAGVQRLPEGEAERAGAGLGDRHHELVLHQGGEAGAPDDELRVSCPARLAGREQLVLCAVDGRPRHVLARLVGHSHPSLRYQSSVRAMPSRSPTRGA